MYIDDGHDVIPDAYAGFTFDLLGATASHVFAGDPVSETLAPVMVFAIGAASYALRPASRRLRLEPLPEGVTS